MFAGFMLNIFINVWLLIACLFTFSNRDLQLMVPHKIVHLSSNQTLNITNYRNSWKLINTTQKNERRALSASFTSTGTLKRPDVY